MTFDCDGVPGVIDLCARACDWSTLQVPNPLAGLDFALGVPAPNPARGSTALNYVVPHAGVVKLEVYDAAGKRVPTLIDGTVGAGMGTVIWDGSAENRKRGPPGLYFARLSMEGRVAGRKIMMLE